MVKNPFKKTPEEKLLQFIDKFRKENIPKDFNQVAGLDMLVNKDIDYIVSISSRTDGKSFNYIGALAAISIEFNLKMCLLVRHFTMRQSYMELLWEIFDVMPYFDVKLLDFERGDSYTNVEYDGKVIATIADINKSTDLKNYSAFLKKFPILVYDEFITLETDYVPQEELHFARIYTTIDREDEPLPIIGSPKVFLLGNPENFASPLMGLLDIYNVLETHPINTGACYDMVYLEMFRNENQNAKRNSRALKHLDNPAQTGDFTFNNTHIANDTVRTRIRQGGFNYFFIKLETGFLKVMFNLVTKETLLSYKVNSKEYDYCTEVADIKPEAIYLKETYYKESHYKYHEKGKYWYDNAYTKTLLTRDPQLIQLKIWRCVSEYRTQHPLTVPERVEKEYKQVYEEQTLKAIYKRFFS